jgi:hypothetical protein
VRDGGIELLDVVDVNPKIVVGGEYGKAERNERATADEEKPASAARQGAKKLGFVELIGFHPRATISRAGQQALRRRIAPLASRPESTQP